MRLLGFFAIVGGLMLGLVYPYITKSVLNFELIKQRVVSNGAETGDFAVNMTRLDGPVRVTFELFVKPAPVAMSPEVSVPVVVGTGDRIVFYDVLTADLTPSDLRPDGLETLSIRGKPFGIDSDGRYDFVVGPVVANGVQVEAIDVTLIGLAYDLPILETRYGWSVFGLGMYLFWIGRRRTRRRARAEAKRATSNGRKRTSDIGRAVPLEREPKNGGKSKPAKQKFKWGRGE